MTDFSAQAPDFSSALMAVCPLGEGCRCAARARGETPEPLSLHELVWLMMGSGMVGMRITVLDDDTTEGDGFETAAAALKPPYDLIEGEDAPEAARELERV